MKTVYTFAAVAFSAVLIASPGAMAQVQLNVCGAPPLPPCADQARPRSEERTIIERDRPRTRTEERTTIERDRARPRTEERTTIERDRTRPQTEERTTIERDRVRTRTEERTTVGRDRAQASGSVCETRALRCRMDEPLPVGSRCTCENADGDEVVGRVR